MPWSRTFLSIVVLALAQLLQAQSAIPIHELAKSEAQASRHFGFILNVRGLSNGNVLVNDGTNMKVFQLDEKLANETVIIGNETQVYGSRAAPLIAYLSDSTLFVDWASRSLLLIDPDGRMVRPIAPVRAVDMPQFGNSTSGADQRGNLVYRAMSSWRIETPDGKLTPPITADSVAIVRANFATRVLDTLTRIKLQPPIAMRDSKDVIGKRIVKTMLNPWLEVDDWAVLSDGTVAVLRGNDYHVDFFDTDKHMTSGARLPFDFRALSSDEKRHLVDSATVADSGGIGTLGTAKVFGEYIPASNLPDYFPSIRAGALKPDSDTNLWILPNTSARSIAGELVYDVVSNKGVMMYRVRLPKGKAIAGFGKNGVVYLMSKNAEGWLLERTRVLK